MSSSVSRNTAVTPYYLRWTVIMVYALQLLFIWSFTMSQSRAFALQKLGTPLFLDEHVPIRAVPKTALNMLPRMLATYPLVVESLVAGGMAGLGDYLAQKRNPTATAFDPIRTSHFIFKGLGEGIMWSFWYRTVEQWSALVSRTIMTSIGLPALESAIKTFLSIMLDLLLACPLIYALWDIPVPAILQGERNIGSQIRNKLGEMVMASCKVWLPVNVLIYNLPVRYRVFVSSTADVFWQSIVSSIASRPLVEQKKDSLL
jgi:hypothetical protein